MKNGDYELVVAPPNFPGKKYRGKYCYKHHLIYWQTYGVVPNKNEIIHHKDEDKHNNDPTNLELKTRKKHSQKHNIQRGKTMVELKCPYCQTIFIKEKRQTYLQKPGVDYTCCSRKCSGQFSHLPTIEKGKRIVQMFIREFKQYT